MGVHRTCGCANEIELAATHGMLVGCGYNGYWLGLRVHPRPCDGTYAIIVTSLQASLNEHTLAQVKQGTCSKRPAQSRHN